MADGRKLGGDLGEPGAAGARRDRDEFEAVGMCRDDPERVLADRARGSE
jgi:hypothetical protein